MSVQHFFCIFNSQGNLSTDVSATSLSECFLVLFCQCAAPMCCLTAHRRRLLAKTSVLWLPCAIN